MEGHVGGGVLQAGHGLHAQAAAKLHIGEAGEHTQFFAGFFHLIVAHAGEIQLRGGEGHILTEQGHTVLQGQRRVGRQNAVNLLRGQVHRGEGDCGKGGQVLQVLKHRVIAEAARFQHHGACLVGNGGAAQIHGIGHVHLGVLLNVLQNGGVAGAAGQIHALQVGVLI